MPKSLSSFEVAKIFRVAIFLGYLATATIGSSQTTLGLHRSQRSTHVDSKEAAILLDRAKSQANQIRMDIAEISALSRSDLSWMMHVTKMAQLESKLNALSDTTSGLIALKQNAAPWQQAAIIRITPLLHELQEMTHSMVSHLSKEEGRFLQTQEHRDLLALSADLSTELAALITDFVEYGQVRDRYFALRRKLELLDRKRL